MDLLNALTLTAPNGFWHTIVLGLEGAIGDYALALILITVIIKLVMVPFDFINKYC
jgi:membrane protein insertase Oxa1/YidC/SpoIIIJ